MKPKHIIAIAVFITLILLILIYNSGDSAVTSFIPAALKKKPAVKTVAPVSPLANLDNRILFAKNGDKEIYKVQKDNQWVVIIDGQESAAYDALANPTFSPDGSQFAYSASLDNQEFVVLDDVEQANKYTDIKQIIFSADGKLLAYLANTSDGKLVVVNGKEGKTYNDIGTLQTESGVTFLAFVPGTDNIVYRAVEGQKTFIVINATEGKQYAEIKTIYFNDKGQIAYYAQSGNNLYTIIDGKVTNVQTITPATDTNNAPIANTALPLKKAKDSSRNLSPDIDKQPAKLNPLICGQTTACNF